MTERSMLDAVVDCLIAGGPVNVIVVPEECQFPDLAGTTGYGKGCKCPRCMAAHSKEVRQSILRTKTEQRWRKQ